MKVTRIQDWPKSSNGAWVIDMIRSYLVEKGLSIEEVDSWFNAPLPIFGDMNSVGFVEHIVDNGNAESYADAWHCVLGQFKRVWG